MVRWKGLEYYYIREKVERSVFEPISSLEEGGGGMFIWAFFLSLIDQNVKRRRSSCKIRYARFSAMECGCISNRPLFHVGFCYVLD